MAYEIPGLVATFKAAGDYTSSQYYFVKLTAADTVTVCSKVTDEPIGVLQNAPNTGEEAEVMLYGISKVSADAALTAGLLIGTSADGQADGKIWGTDKTEFIVGRVITATGAAGGLATAAINCIVPVKAVTSA